MTDLPVLTSPLLDLPGIRHAFFTRQGGVSHGIYASLNVGVGSKDDPNAVTENRRRAAAHLGGALVTAYQVHSATAHVADRPWPDAPPEGDAVVTATPGVVCGALAADCAPILLADAEARVVGAAHAGWKGALTGVAEDAIARMESLGARRGRIVAAVGPCIGPASYEVGLEYEARFTDKDPAYGRFFTSGAGPDKRQFDLPAFVLHRLRVAGIERCEWIGRDTCAEPELFFSNRRAFKLGEPDYGRLLSAIVLT
ncbi:peptidoglycan editing factor PgeF [Phenylobacterium kunshanense]|uniref:Purine nucleoside phosphorylase n=1 Tax=Phenylobacterium kunshanense TaxID=1445034 RepID=A0A328BA76_9CAUL|nr:peptidoglycan editing factor PgeF [Phenylobacterium kunshanense]RAK64222.1 peptidoglycan editing factor PgeF [Phenylobacterium kunshanense]